MTTHSEAASSDIALGPGFEAPEGFAGLQIERELQL